MSRLFLRVSSATLPNASTSRWAFIQGHSPEGQVCQIDGWTKQYNLGDLWKKTPYVWGDGLSTFNWNTYNGYINTYHYHLVLWRENSDCQHPLRCESPLGFVPGMTTFPTNPLIILGNHGSLGRPYHHISKHQTVSKQPEVFSTKSLSL